MEKLTATAVAVPLLIIYCLVREFLPLLWSTLRDDGPHDAPSAVVPTAEPITKHDFLTVLTIAVSFYLLCLWRLGYPNVMFFDEVHHVHSAMEYVWGQPPHEWSHPPLTKIIIAGFMKLFHVSFDPTEGVWKDSNTYSQWECIVWRFPSVCFGTMSLVGIYMLARSLFGNRWIATYATTLLALDGLFFVHSRIGMTNIMTVCFIVYGTLGTWLYMKHRDRRWLLLTGLALGLSLCTRWSSLWAWGMNGLMLLTYLVRSEIPHWQASKKNVAWQCIQWLALVAFVMIVIPLALYFASYIPFVLQKTTDWQKQLFSTGEPGPPDWSRVFARDNYAAGHGWYKVINQQKDMWNYHAEIRDTHPYMSPWWTWPLMLRPVWYHFQSQSGHSTGIWSLGNAVVWWSSVPALVFAAVLAYRERIAGLGVVSLLGLGMWLCWAVKSRPLTFMHYYFESIPFACIALAYLGWRLWQTNDENAQRFVRIFGILAGLWFFFYYPLLSAQPIPDWYFRWHLWLDPMWV